MLSASVLGGLIDANLASAGAVGSKRTIFSNKVAAGIVMSIVGKSFTTSDTGLTPGAGTGTGTGITGLSSSSMKSIALSTMVSQGDKADPLMNAIMMAVVQHLSAAADLSSNDSPVYLGTGTIDVGSIAVVISEMSGNILSQLNSAGAVGAKRANLSLAIATGVVTNILAAGTGSLTITGAAPPIPVPGSGTGTGTIA